MGVRVPIYKLLMLPLLLQNYWVFFPYGCCYYNYVIHYNTSPTDNTPNPLNATPFIVSSPRMIMTFITILWAINYVLYKQYEHSHNKNLNMGSGVLYMGKIIDVFYMGFHPALYKISMVCK